MLVLLGTRPGGLLRTPGYRIEVAQTGQSGLAEVAFETGVKHLRLNGGPPVTSHCERNTATKEDCFSCLHLLLLHD